MSYISAELRRLVTLAAKGCCEYCRIHNDDNFLSHEIDHIVSEKHRGSTTLENLCLSCFDCNRYKGSDIGSLDVDTNQYVQLFNPRTMNWDEHFQLDNFKISPISAIGRVTEFVLRFNSEERLQKRRELLRLLRYPC